jgi:hypothetical protein
MCCLCFRRVPVEELHVTEDGVPEDVCKTCYSLEGGDREMSKRAEVLHDVFIERERQDIKWGGADHDDQHDSRSWRALIVSRTEREPLSRDDDRRLFVEMAALAVAAVEAYDRKWERQG